MLDKRLLVTGAAILMVAAVAAVAALFPKSEAVAPIQEPVSDVAFPRQPQRESSEPERDYLYLIKEHEGYIAVFGESPDVPELILEKLVKHLPEYDRIQLREGVKVYSAQELDARIEDYNS